MNFKAIIFDLDGTIADTLPLCIASFKKSIEPLLNKSLSNEEIIATFGPSEEGTIRALIPQQEAQGVKDYLLHYEAMHHTCPAMFPGINELLQTLADKGVQLAMVTGKGIHSTKLSLKQFDATRYFEVLETGSPDGPDKVNGIKRVLQRLNIQPGEALYVGDAPSDITSCKEVGVPIAEAAWAHTTNAAELIPLKPDFIFYSVDDFKDWVIENTDSKS
ncbi:HAD family hydrolase [Mucilaginibacter conchicola]|uniref:phosphoglycolate phosphatase n=1 Tax=Mucilaginibacter conchicola TaxID=2303333 RepID=A0A372NY79_9SPHI|nr:HAD family hydrolase [Mucilaginibacter conchicola]RFZ95078.1 HAD family hydrolase [Mucilaginibacter conchicola]